MRAITGLVSVSVRLATAAAAVLALAVMLACGSNEETVPAASSTPSATTAVPTPTTLPAAPTTPGLEWTVYTQQASAKSDSFSFSHPPGWAVEGGEVTTPGRGLNVVMWSWMEGTPPPASVKVDLIVEPSPFASCERKDNAEAFKLAGLEGWAYSYSPDPATEPQLSGVESVHVVAGDTKDFRYCFVAYALQGFDYQVFARLAQSFQLVP